MAREKDKKSKRRGSQAFGFEQSEETLLQNETICKLYQNKNFVAPSPSELEGILEDTVMKGQDKRVRRREGAIVYPGLKKEYRFVEPYKFWRVDNVDRIKKRRAMVTKLWKGRKKPKSSHFSKEMELYLEQLIELKDESFESEEEEGGTCLWRKDKEAGDSESSQEEDQGCVWAREEVREAREVLEPQVILGEEGVREVLEVLEPQVSLGEEEVREALELHASPADKEPLDMVYKPPAWIGQPVSEARNRKSKNHYRTAMATEAQGTIVTAIEQRMAMDKETNPVRMTCCSVTVQEAEDSFSSLAGLIPAHELEEMMGSEDLLFCGETSKKPKARKRKVRRDSTRPSTRRSVRRSARLSSNPGCVGSIFTDVEALTDELDDVNISVKENKSATKPGIVGGASLEKSPVSVAALEEQHKCMALKKLSKSKSRVKRRSGNMVPQDVSRGTESKQEGSLEESKAEQRGDGSTSGNSSRRSSVLGGSLLAGADIFLPEAVRRSLTGEFLPPRSSSSTTLSEVWRSGELEDSGSEEEIISGMFASRT